MNEEMLEKARAASRIITNKGGITMAEINDKDLEKATGGMGVQFPGHPSAAKLKEWGFTLITDTSKGFYCDDFCSDTGHRAPCGGCDNITFADDTHEMFCTRGR